MSNIIGMLSLNIYALIISLIVCVLFFSKKRLHQVEDKVYSWFLIFNILATFSGVILGMFVEKAAENLLLVICLNKLYLILLSVWGSLLTYYTIYVSVIKKQDKNYYRFKKMFLFVLFAVNMTILYLPIQLNVSDSGSATVSGPAMIFMFSYFGLLFLIDLVYIVRDRKNVGSKKYFPIYILMVLGGFTFTIQAMYPDLNYLLNPLTVITTLVMYFTIENPDLKMIAMLDEAKMAAEKANRAKSDFLSNMSHEIRTPLNAIVGFSDCILEENSLEDAQNDAKDIKLASENLLEIVNGILDISKIEADKMEIVETDYNPVETLENVAKLVRPRLGEKPIELTVKFAPDIPYMLHGDGGKLRQVVTNILTNAAKYTEKGTIAFYISCVNQGENSDLVISVEDTGRGIKPEQIDKLFTKFQRLDEDKNTTLEGTGLGLAITKRFVEMMGGKIVVQSKYGEGSKFTVYIRQKIVMMSKPEEHLVNDFNKLNRLNEVDLTQAKVLVVDDNKVNIKVALKLLSNYGINADSFDSGFDCIESVKNGTKYDLILLDDMMPKITGGETLVELKKIPGYNTPTVALTANAISGMREQYINMGFTDYLSKPIEKNELYRVLTTYIKPKDGESVATNTPSVSTPVVENNTPKIDYKDCTGKKVLIVDDNKINIKICTRMIDDYNFEIDSCLSGQECLDKVKETHYDLIYMDYMMPEMDGIETLKHLKDMGITCPIVCLTADAVEGAREKFLSAGFDEYISKPIDRELMDDIVNRFIK